MWQYSTNKFGVFLVENNYLRSNNYRFKLQLQNRLDYMTDDEEDEEKNTPV